MKFAQPIEINDTNLFSSTIPEPDVSVGEIEWTAGTYNTGDEVILSNTHLVYKSAVDGNTDSPDVGAAKDVPTWVAMGYTNRYRMFTGAYDSISTSSSSIVFEIVPSENISLAAFLGLSSGVSTIQVEVIHNVDGTIYDKTISTQVTGTVGWWNWFFSPIYTVDSLVFSDLTPRGSGVTIRVTVSGINPSVGRVVLGFAYEFGDTLYGTTVSRRNFSVRSRDGFGNSVRTNRRSVKLVNYQVAIKTSRIDEVYSRINEVQDNPALWIGEEDKSSTVVFGICEYPRIPFEGYDTSAMSLEVEEI